MTALAAPVAAALAATLGLATPALSFSLPVSSTVTLGYGNVDSNGVDLDKTALDLHNLWDFGALNIETDLRFNRLSDGNVRLDALDYYANPSYEVSPGLRAGAFYQRTKLSFSGGGGGGDVVVQSGGLTLAYKTEMYRVEGYAGVFDVDPGPSDQDNWTYGVNATFTPREGVVIGALVNRSEVSGAGSLWINSAGLSAAMDVTPDFAVFGGVIRADLDGSASLTRYGLGVGYDLSKVSSMPAILSLEVSRSEVDGGIGNSQADEISLSITVPLGAGKASRLPQGSVASDVLNGTYNSLSGDTLFFF